MLLYPLLRTGVRPLLHDGLRAGVRSLLPDDLHDLLSQRRCLLLHRPLRLDGGEQPGDRVVSMLRRRHEGGIEHGGCRGEARRKGHDSLGHLGPLTRRPRSVLGHAAPDNAPTPARRPRPPRGSFCFSQGSETEVETRPGGPGEYQRAEATMAKLA